MKDNAPLRFILITISVLIGLMLLIVVIQIVLPSTDGTPVQDTGLGQFGGRLFA